MGVPPAAPYWLCRLELPSGGAGVAGGRDRGRCRAGAGHPRRDPRAEHQRSLKGAHKTLFRLRPRAAETTRVVIAEAQIDALSVAAVESLQTDSLYVATGGGMGPGTLAALQTICAELAARPGSIVESAAGVAFRRLRPPEGLDWNDLQQGRGHEAGTRVPSGLAPSRAS